MVSDIVAMLGTWAIILAKIEGRSSFKRNNWTLGCCCRQSLASPAAQSTTSSTLADVARRIRLASPAGLLFTTWLNSRGGPKQLPISCEICLRYPVL